MINLIANTLPSKTDDFLAVGLDAKTPEPSGRALRDSIYRCCNFPMFRQSVAALGITVGGATDDQLIDIYFNNQLASTISPNPYFDEQWYKAANQDVFDGIKKGKVYSGFVHFVTLGLFEGRWPNPVLHALVVSPDEISPAVYDLDVAFYLDKYGAARSFLSHFPSITPLQHYNLYGRFMGYQPSARDLTAPLTEDDLFMRIASEFDPDFYRNQYMKTGEAANFSHDPFSHYLIYGTQRAHSPNPYFDEAWYRAFYGEVRLAIARGEVVSGFYHFVAAGRAEGRMPRFDLKQALEARIPGVTRPALMHRVPEIRMRLGLRKIVATVDHPPRVWFLIPTINPDITFGGYRSAFELLNALHVNGYPVGIICTEDAHADKEYFLWREKSTVFKRLVDGIPFVNQAREAVFQIGLRDTVVVYSAWDLYLADHLRRSAPDLRVILLTQEYEPIFYDSCSVRAIVEDAYGIDHYALINSELLRNYLSTHKVGAFGRDHAAEAGRDYAVFEHRINILPSQDLETIKQRRERILVAYARPEGHAARNMFEIVILALQQICEEGLFGPEWNFIGLGALTDMEPIELGDGHRLEMRQKMTEEEYTKCVACMDIGVSLMFAPHPSVVPFEFATTGAVVVTNTYENRSAEDLSRICPNIIAGRPSISGIAAALRAAVRLVPDVEARVRNIFRPQNTSWEAIFDKQFLEVVFGSPLETAPVVFASETASTMSYVKD